MDGTLYHYWLWYLLRHNLPMLIVNAIFLLVQLLFPLLNSWLGFKHQNLEEGRWSRTTWNPANGFWCDRHVDTDSCPQEREVLWVYTSCCKSMHSMYELLFYHTYACFVSMCYLMCTSPCRVYYYNFFHNIFRIPQKWGPLEVLISRRAQLKQQP
jgi:hypothetical protein